MMTAPAKPKGQAASPIISANSLNEWANQKASLRGLFEAEIYGVMPRDFGTFKTDTKIISGHPFQAFIEEVTLKPAYGESYNVVLVTPKDRVGPVAVIMMENFCPNHNVIPVEGISKPEGISFDCSGEGLMANIFGYFFGRYITTPPIDMIMEHGYALAVIYPPANYPDDAAKFAKFRESPPSKEYVWGAIGAWAYQFSSLSNFLKSDGRFSKTISYGHSRYGKSALLSAAYDETIDGVIAHQSGTGGASLSKDKKGETVADITEAYPHWFTPAYSEDSLTIDQHQLLALIAPRPILLGNTKRDVWSDPEGAFRAAKGASHAYELYGSAGFTPSKLTQFKPNEDIAYWIRPGTHGVVKEDWPAFLEFMDAHFK